MFSKKVKLCCRFCFTDLWLEHTFIKCATTACIELGVSLCLQCFAAGTADNVHKNTDPYQVLCNAIDIGDHLWAAHEEITLLDTYMDTMSWDKVARKLGRSPKECECHYFDNYVLYPKIKGLECVNKNAFRFDRFDNMNKNMTNAIGDTLDLEESHHQYELAIRLAGYQPARGSFEEEYDNQAECILQLLDEPTWIDQESKTILESNVFYKRLNTTIFDIFNERLHERYRRREIVKDYGLIAFNKHQLWIKSMEMILGPEMMRRLIRYLHLIKPLAFDLLITNLKQEHELLAKIHKLIVYRKNGLTKIAQINIYKELSAKREEYLKIRPLGSSTSRIIENSKPRMNVCNLPGFQKLDDDERELCALIKMLPESYLKFKELLINECEKSKGIILKTARSLVKIDVNKTRKIYNLLMGKNIIWQHSQD
ncbi:transcriptional adapter 2-alpha [Metopolophium dirhodum]|uniref:transcriptional adapter 2-alpha n=1 Tax=Metopolophium dirhodum TaxID=44670 RepID=UPI00298FA972|nr:transcriptional adapter 2-alpha [Metopolophium dirhodum]